MTPARPFLLVGLTGGIATGKSTVAAMFRALGGVVIDADLLAREVVEPGEPALAEIAREFGPGVLKADGQLDRKALGVIVFADDGRRRRLEAITHPRIRERLARRLDELGAQGFRGLVFYDAALLVESDGWRAMDRVIVVAADESTQIARLTARDGISRDDAVRRVRSQMPLRRKARLAHYVINNSGERAGTRAQVREVHAALERYLAARARRA